MVVKSVTMAVLRDPMLVKMTMLALYRVPCFSPYRLASYLCKPPRS